LIEDSYRKLVSEAGGLAFSLEDAINQTSPRIINQLMAAELPQLQSLTRQLEETTPPAEAADPHARLVEGLKTFADDLMAVQEEATLAASAGDVYQSGVFFNGMDVVEGGGRMRWELANSHGLAAIRAAVAELKAVGCTASGAE
jgi:hypothetical protein